MTNNIQLWTFVMLGLSFTLHIYIAIRSRAANTKDFYVAGERAAWAWSFRASWKWTLKSAS